MNVRFFSENAANGTIILEHSPVRRTIVTNSGYETWQFPYLTHIIFYKKFKYGNKTSYIYPGLGLESTLAYDEGNLAGLRSRKERWLAGLQVFFRGKPISSFKDKYFYSPTDVHNGVAGKGDQFLGISCTPHEYDNSNYNSLKELIENVQNFWWSSQHRPMGWDSNYNPKIVNFKKAKSPLEMLALVRNNLGRTMNLANLLKKRNYLNISYESKLINVPFKEFF